MSDRAVRLPLSRIEGAHLAGLVDEFRELLAGAASARADRGAAAEDDPALARLAPDAYPDDPDASAEFAAHTRAPLWDRRAQDARTMRAGLESFAADLAALRTGALDERAATAPRDVVIAMDEVDAWLRTLTALRLVIASRLGIDTEDDHDPDDPRFGVYDWLGYRLDGLIEAADDA